VSEQSQNDKQPDEADATDAPGAPDAPEVREPAVDIERELRRLVRRVRRYSTDLARLVHPNLDPALYSMLVDLVERGPSRAADIAIEQGVTKGVVSRQVRSLDQLGFLRRLPDPTDARAQILAVTPAAEVAVARAQAARRAAIDRLLDASTDDELTAMATALSRFNDVME
jgi:DNA-binding MarR family transcriptional regulator